MTDRPIDLDDFGATLEQIIGSVGSRVQERLPEAVNAGVKEGAKEWRKNAREAFPKDQTYRKHGKTYTSGAYAKSIRSHMVVKDGPMPSGEVGAPNMPGLPHLLEFGHAKSGGGRVPGREHIAPAAEVAFDATERIVSEMVEGVLNDG